MIVFSVHHKSNVQSANYFQPESLKGDWQNSTRIHVNHVFLYTASETAPIWLPITLIFAVKLPRDFLIFLGVMLSLTDCIWKGKLLYTAIHHWIILSFVMHRRGPRHCFMWMLITCGSALITNTSWLQVSSVTDATHEGRMLFMIYFFIILVVLIS